MTTLRIEHRISSFEGWRKAFDSDPINRRQSGVRRYRIFRPVDHPNFVAIDLDFDDPGQARATKAALEKIFPKIEGSLIHEVRLLLFEAIEFMEL